MRSSRRAALGKPLTIMQSSGGAMSAAAAAERPIHIIESGPAAGVVGAAELARRLGDMQPAQLRHGRHDRQGGARRERAGSCASTALEVGGGINIAGRLLERRRLSRAARRRSTSRRWAPAAAASRGSMRAAGCGRARERGRRAGARVLRARRHAADGHRCERRPRLHQSTRARRRRTCPSGATLAAACALDAHVARPLGSRLRRRRLGRASRRERHDGARAARRVDRARSRSARSTHAGLRRQRTGACGDARAPARHSSASWCRPCPGVFSALGMLFPDVEHHYVRTFKRRLDVSTRGARRGVRRARSRKARRAARGRLRRRPPSLRALASTCAMPARIRS